MIEKHVKFGLGLTCKGTQIGKLITTIHTPKKNDVLFQKVFY